MNVINNALEMFNSTKILNSISSISFENMGETVQKATIAAKIIFNRDPDLFIGTTVLMIGWGGMGCHSLYKAYQKNSVAEKAPYIFMFFSAVLAGVRLGPRLCDFNFSA